MDKIPNFIQLFADETKKSLIYKGKDQFIVRKPTTIYMNAVILRVISLRSCYIDIHDWCLFWLYCYLNKKLPQDLGSWRLSFRLAVSSRSRLSVAILNWRHEDIRNRISDEIFTKCFAEYSWIEDVQMQVCVKLYSFDLISCDSHDVPLIILVLIRDRLCHN